MDKAIQLLQITPQELKEAILEGVKAQLDELKKEYQPKSPTEYLTRQDVADLLQVDLSTLWSWTKKGKLKSYGLGNRVLYKRHEVEQSLIPLNE